MFLWGSRNPIIAHKDASHPCNDGKSIGLAPYGSSFEPNSDKARSARLELRILGQGGHRGSGCRWENIGNRVTSWDHVRDAAINCTQKKKDDHRFDGEGTFDMKKVPTDDLMEKMETVE